MRDRAWKDHDPLDEETDRMMGRQWAHRVKARLAEIAVEEAVQNLHPGDDDWRYDLTASNGLSVDMKTKMEDLDTTKLDIRTRGREPNGMADLYLITAMRDTAAVHVIGYLTAGDVYTRGYHSPRTEHDDTLTVDLEHLRPVDEFLKEIQ